MKLRKALEVVRVTRRMYGERAHCGEPMCHTCAMLSLARELDRLTENQRTCVCGRVMVDGVCGHCSG